MSWASRQAATGPDFYLLAERFGARSPSLRRMRVFEPELHLVGLSFGALHPAWTRAPQSGSKAPVAGAGVASRRGSSRFNVA